MYVICFYFWSANSSDRGAFILASPSMSRVPSEDCKVVNRKARNKTFETIVKAAPLLWSAISPPAFPHSRSKPEQRLRKRVRVARDEATSKRAVTQAPTKQGALNMRLCIM